MFEQTKLMRLFNAPSFKQGRKMPAEATEGAACSAGAAGALRARRAALCAAPRPEGSGFCTLDSSYEDAIFSKAGSIYGVDAKPTESKEILNRTDTDMR